MSAPRIAELFAGYGGLGMGVQAVLGGEIAWFSEFDAAPSRILAHHWPAVPNHGDITKIDWSQVEPVDILTGGFPCQDVSLAGARKGLKEGTRSGLWSYFAEAINQLQPRLVVIENVRGLLSAEAGGSVEPDPWGVGDGATRPVINALGAVLGDLADLGYDADWVGVRAADAGAPHGRYRVFIVANPQGKPWGIGHGDDVRAGGRAIGRASTTRPGALEYAHPATGDQRRLAAPGQTESGRARADASGRSGAPATDTDGLGRERGKRGPQAGPPATQEHSAPDRDSQGLEVGGPGVIASQAGGDSRATTVGNSPPVAWGVYGPAIHRWESVLNRTAPSPTNPDGKNGSHRLSAAFVEWMMGLPEGHVTDLAIGLTRNEQLKALGNGVVPQQAALALSILTKRMETAA